MKARLSEPSEAQVSSCKHISDNLVQETSLSALWVNFQADLSVWGEVLAQNELQPTRGLVSSSGRGIAPADFSVLSIVRFYLMWVSFT